VGALVVGLFKAGFVGFGLWLVDRVGRRPLLLWSCAVVTLSLVALAGCLAAKAPPAAVGAALCAFTGAFAVGEGPVTWVLVSEIFPMRLRGRAVALAMCLNRMTSGAVSMTFLSLSEALGGAGGAFGMFAAVSALHTALVWALVPETKGRSLEEIEASFGATEMGRGGCGSSSSSSSATVADSGGGDGNGGDGDDAEKGGGAGAHAHGGGHGGGHGIDPGREITPQKAWVHLVKGNVGPGCLSLAAGASQAGEAGSLVLGVVIVAVCLAGWHMIWQCKVHTQASGARTFGDIGDRAFGRRGRDTIEFFVMFTQLAVCCVFFSFFAVNIHAALPAGGALDWLTPATIMLLALPFFLYVGSLKDLKVLVPFSQAAIAALLLGFAIVLYYCADWLRRGQPRAPLAPSLGGATLFFGTAVYALEGVALLLPIENAMGADARGQFGSVMNWAMLAIVASFVLLTAVPLAAFGAVKSSSLTAELGAHYGGEALVTVCNLLLVLNVALTYPLQFLPTFQVVEQWVRGMARARPQLLHGGGGGGGGGGGRGGSGDSAEGGEADLAAPAGPLCITDGARGSINSAGGSSDSAARGHEVAGVGNGGGVTTTADASDAPACLRSCPCTLSPRALEHLQTYPWLRAYMVVFTMLVAASVPDLGLLISLFGSVASSTLGLILPPLMYVRLVPGQTAASTAACYSMCAFGVLGAVGGAVSSLQGIAKAYGK
jgi:amino acid permease